MSTRYRTPADTETLYRVVAFDPAADDPTYREFRGRRKSGSVDSILYDGPDGMHLVEHGDLFTEEEVDGGN